MADIMIHFSENEKKRLLHYKILNIKIINSSTLKSIF